MHEYHPIFSSLIWKRRLASSNYPCTPTFDAYVSCCKTMQLPHDILCPHWPRPLGLAVHKVSLPLMLKPLWCDRYLAFYKKIISLSAVSCLLAMTVADLLFDCCFDCCAAVAHFLHNCNCQCSLPTVSALGHDCSWLSCWTFVARPQYLVPLLVVTTVGLL